MRAIVNGGSIVSIASTRAEMSEPHTRSLCSNKRRYRRSNTCFSAFFRCPDNITVNCISPGWIETGDYEQLLETPTLKGTGTNLTVDGGMTKKMMYEE
ncbi:SDR family oxidoreductase [Lysinibacillus sp. NPDC093190]|uniref:SDR family oxidoreductase n=1 Tax=Lysinibacillus sp. NPDC093190 TaxID=3390575 RepID=UPI003CFF5EFA